VRGRAAPGVVVAVVLALACSSCAAVEQALGDPGDEGLAEQAVARAEGTVPEPATFERRPVTFTIDAPDERTWSQTGTDEGTCGWGDDGVWRADLGDGGTTYDGSGGYRFDGLVLSSATDDVRAPAPGEPRVLDAAVDASWLAEDDEGSVTGWTGRVEVDASGLSARFTAPPELPERHPLGGAVVTVECGGVA
jgi:hypothetical protein